MKSKVITVAVVTVYILNIILLLYVLDLVLATSVTIFKVGLESGSVYISQSTAQILMIYSILTAIFTCLTWLATKTRASKVGAWLSATVLASLASLMLVGAIRIMQQ